MSFYLVKYSSLDSSNEEFIGEPVTRHSIRYPDYDQAVKAAHSEVDSGEFPMVEVCDDLTGTVQCSIIVPAHPLQK